MADRKPSLARSGRAFGDDEFVPPQGLDISVLRGVAGAHRAALARCDLVKGAAPRRLLGREEHALKGALLDRPIDISGRQRRAVLDAPVEAFQDAARLFGGLRRHFDDDAVTIHVSDDAEPPLQMGDVLVVLAEDEAGPAIILKTQGNFGRLLDARMRMGRRTPPLPPRRNAIDRPQNLVSLHAVVVKSPSVACSPNRLFDPARTIRTGTVSPT